jgi:hypothetical protein
MRFEEVLSLWLNLMQARLCPKFGHGLQNLLNVEGEVGQEI